ncbi:MAG: VCBS repeat-containing protein, partial [Deltaproteobacteria bacterium]|nr:VCBS repeat-containing protein [Deltaproteobacteria bacterium]
PGTGGELQLRFLGWGREGALEPVADVEPEIGACTPEIAPDGSCGRQLEYNHGSAIAWWANTAAGLEQGWDLADRPAGEGALVLEVEVEGAEISGDEWELEFATATRHYRYSALSAWDADGNELLAWFEVEGSTIRILVDDTAATWPVMVDPLLTSATTTLNGENTSDNFGYAVEAAGDVNNDGYDDLAVGAYGYSSSTGRVYVFHGSASGVSTTAATTLDGPASSAYFGAATRGAGDVNGDGYDDLIVGAYGYSSSAGAAYVYYGSSSGITTSGAVTVSSISGAGTEFGRCVSGAGDVNNDGYDDVVIGADKYSTDIGRVYVLHGGAGSLDTTADTTIGGGSTSYFGFACDSAGDVDNDGYDDIVVGAYGYSSNKGRAYVFHGSSSGVSGTATSTFTGGASSYYLGYDVAGLGDVNGDGYDDVAIGMHGYVSYTGRVRVYHGGASGADTTVDADLTGSTAGYYFGFGIDGAGDVDGDGYNDVIVGERLYGGNTGRAYLYTGSSSGVSTTADTELPGTSGSQFGRSVGGLGDVNGDGYGDVGVGGNTLTTSTGRAWVFHGYADADGDGYVVGGEGSDQDCDDTDASVYPGASETTGDGIDSDCDGGETCYADGDGDGYTDGSTVASADSDCGDAGEATSSDPTGDCDDGDASAYPGGTETCDGADNDCDGTADDGVGSTWYADDDGDGYGDATDTVTACTAPSGYVATGTDCNDTYSWINPGRGESVGNHYDEDCSGAATCYADADNDGYRTSTTIISADTDCRDSGEGITSDPTGDCDDTTAAISPADTEICDAADTDEDCDGDADDADSSTSSASMTSWYLDNDLDGYGDASSTTLACDAGAGRTTDDSDCDDTDASISPAGTEVCDAADADEDCDGLSDDADPSVDAGSMNSYYADNDGDGYGDGASIEMSCDGASGVSNDDDCDDADASVSPAATETVGDGVDVNCDGAEDCYADADEDNYRTSDTVASADTDCADPGEARDTTPDGDCDDGNAVIYPGGLEDPGDEVDGNCDGEEECYVDADGDGYASDDGSTTISSDLDCADAGEASSLTPGGDCDDSDPAYNPGASETCDDPEDYNCDGTVAFTDIDGDGWAACEECDDGNASAYPGATETVGNGIDEDCDGGELCYVDVDGDGTRPDDSTVASSDADCTDAGEASDSAVSGDCDDADPAYYPGAPETCDDPTDYNCDGSVGAVDNDGDSYYACDECDDNNALIYPGAPELCNDADDDCDGTADEEAIDVATWYADADGDSFGDPLVSLAECDQPANYVADMSDCDDTNGEINPVEDDIPGNGIDENCDGEDATDTGEDTGGDTAETGDTEETGTPDDTAPVADDVENIAGGGGCGCSTANPAAAGGVLAAGVSALALLRRRRG